MPKIAILGILLSVSLFCILVWLNFATTDSSIQVTNPNVDIENPEKVRCSDFLTNFDAQNFFNAQKNTYKYLDKDNDGIVCEQLP